MPIEPIEKDVTTTAELPETLDALPEPSASTQLKVTQQQTSKMKELLASIVDAISQEPSYFSRVSAMWGEMPWWLRIGVGILVTVPMIVVGILLHSALIIGLAVLTTLLYSATSYLFYDHNQYTVETGDQLKESIFGLADLFDSVMNSLTLLSEKIAAEVGRLHQENGRLSTKLIELQSKNEEVCQQVASINQSVEGLQLVVEGLVDLASTLEQSVKDQTVLLEINKADLAKLFDQYEHNKTQLNEKIVELNQVKTDMRVEISKANKTAKALQKTVNELAETVIPDAEERTVFKEKLEGFMKNREKSFTLIAKRIKETNQELMQAKEALRQNNQRYDDLLAREDAQISYLEKNEQSTVGGALMQTGLFAMKSADPMNIEPKPNVTELTLH